jgi:hypothetical protein
MAESRKVMDTYKRNDAYFLMLEPVGSWDRDGCRHMVKWQKILTWWWPWPVDEEFWLDTNGFEKTSFGKVIKKEDNG